MSTVNLLIARSLTNKEQQAIEKDGEYFFFFTKKKRNFDLFF